MGIRMIKRKNGNRWRAEKKIGDERYSKTCKSKQEAERWLKWIEQLQTTHSGSNQYETKMTVRQAFVRLVDAAKRKEHDPSTINQLMYKLVHLEPILDMEISSLTEKQILDWFKTLKSTLRSKGKGAALGQRSMVGVLSVFSRTLEIAAKQGVVVEDWDLIEASLKGYIANRATPPTEKMPYTLEEVRTLLEYVITEYDEPYWVLPLIKILIMTGKRIGEVLGITNDKIDHSEMTLRIDQIISSNQYKKKLKKNAKPQTIKMDRELSEVIKELQELNKKFSSGSPWLFPNSGRGGNESYPKDQNCPYKGKPMSVSRVTYYVDLRMKTAGIRDLNIHMLRSTYATLRAIQLLRAKNPMYRQIVQNEMNHKKTEMTDRYIRIAEEYLEEDKKVNVITTVGTLKTSRMDESSDLSEFLKVNGVSFQDVDTDLLKSLILAVALKNKKIA